MSLVRVNRDLTLNTDDVVGCVIDRRHYANGPGPTWLVIRMRDRSEYRIEHAPQRLGGDDVYAIKARLEGAA